MPWVAELKFLGRDIVLIRRTPLAVNSGSG